MSPGMSPASDIRDAPRESLTGAEVTPSDHALTSLNLVGTSQGDASSQSVRPTRTVTLILSKRAIPAPHPRKGARMTLTALSRWIGPRSSIGRIENRQLRRCYRWCTLFPVPRRGLSASAIATISLRSIYPGFGQSPPLEATATFDGITDAIDTLAETKGSRRWLRRRGADPSRRRRLSKSTSTTLLMATGNDRPSAFTA